MALSSSKPASFNNFALLDGTGGIDVCAFAGLLGGCLALGDRLFRGDAGFLLGAFGRLFRGGFVGDVAFLVEFGFALGPLDGLATVGGLPDPFGRWRLRYRGRFRFAPSCGLR